MSDDNGVWLSITDYSKHRDKSISTIRRYIKSNQVRYKKEDGKFFIYTTNDNYIRRKDLQETELLELKLEQQRLNQIIRVLKEENHDLKMLVDIYEKKSVDLPPEIPLEH